MKPWTCPACGRGVAPGVKTCDHGNGEPLDLKGREFLPALPPATPFNWPRFVPPGRTEIYD